MLCSASVFKDSVPRIRFQNSQNTYLCLLESNLPLRYNSSPLQIYSVTLINFLPWHFPSRKFLAYLPTCHINMFVYSYTFHLFYPILALYLNFYLNYYVYDLCLNMTVFAIFKLAFYQFLFSPKTEFILCPLYHPSPSFPDPQF